MRLANQMSESALTSDEMVTTIAIVGTPEAVVDSMKTRLGELISRTGFGSPDLESDELGDLLTRLRS